MPPGYPDGSELDGGEEAVGAFVVSGGDGAEMLEFAEEAFDEIAIATEERVERRDAYPARPRLDAGPCTACGQGRAHGVAVVSVVAEQNIALAKAIGHIGCAAPVMCLPFGQLEPDQQAAARTPMQRDLSSFFGVGSVLVNPDRGAVDHLDVALISC